MATTIRDTTSHVKEKITTKSPSSTNQKNDQTTQGRKPSKSFASSSTASKGLAVVTDKPSPHYLKATASSTKEAACQYGKKHASDDTSIKTSQSRRKSIDKAPTPEQLKRTLSSGPSERRRLTSQSSPLKKAISPKRERSTSLTVKTSTISPKRVPERSLSTKTPSLSAKSPSLSTKSPSLSTKTPTTTTTKTVAKPAMLKKSATTLTPTRPKKVSKPSTSSKSATATPTSPNPDTIDALLMKAEEENKADLAEEIGEVSIEVVPEQMTQVDDAVDKLDTDQTTTEREETELMNAENPEEEIEILKSSIEGQLSENEDLPKEEEIQHDIIEDNVKLPEETQPEPEAIVEETREPAEETSESAEVNADENKEETVKEEKTASPKTLTLGGKEVQTPRKLNFQQGKRLEMKESQDEPNLRLKFKERKDDRGDEDEKAESENVVLKHQDVQGRKESPAYNDVIEETAIKLVGKRKSKVKALVGAFETVINLENDTQE